MVIAGIDFGLKKVGVAIADGKLAEPYSIIRYENKELLFKTIKAVIEKEGIQKIVVGVSEGEMGKKTKEFSESLRREIDIPVETFDETLSTQDAQRLSMEAGIKRSKRKRMEDAYAAAVMLQNYLEVSG